MNKVNVTSLQNRLLFSHKKEWAIGNTTPPENILILERGHRKPHIV